MSRSPKFWDRIADSYDAKVDTSSPGHIEYINKLTKHLKPNDTVLDFGCANGLISVEITSKVKHVHGIDISSKMIEGAEQRATDAGVDNVQFEQSTIFDENLEAGSYDAVLALNILHLLEFPEKAMERIHQLLKPGGVFISSTACMGESRGVVAGIIRFISLFGVLPSVTSFTTAELKSIVKDSGFEIVEEEESGRGIKECYLVATRNEL